MKAILTVARYTFRESLARKTFVGFFIISSIILLLLLGALNFDVVDGAISSLRLFGREAEGIDIGIDKFVFGIEVGLATLLFTGGLFLSIFATAGLIPAMLEKGNIDWLLSRPISRQSLLLGRAAGAVAVVAFNVFYLILGAWLILSIKSGIWHASFLLSGLLLVLLFAAIYAFMALIGVALQNSALAIMAAYLMLFFSPFLYQKDKIYALLSDKIYQHVLTGLYFAVAPSFELGELMNKLVLQRGTIEMAPVGHALILALLYFAGAVLIFKRKNF